MMVNVLICMTITSVLFPSTVSQVIIRRPVLMNTNIPSRLINNPLAIRRNTVYTNNGPLRLLTPSSNINKPNWFYTQQNLQPPNTILVKPIQLGNRELQGIHPQPGQRPGTGYYINITPVTLKPAVQSQRPLQIPTMAPFTNPTNSLPETTKKPNFEEITKPNSIEENHNDGQDTDFDIDIRIG